MASPQAVMNRCTGPPGPAARQRNRRQVNAPRTGRKLSLVTPKNPYRNRPAHAAEDCSITHRELEFIVIQPVKPALHSREPGRCPHTIPRPGSSSDPLSLFLPRVECLIGGRAVQQVSALIDTMRFSACRKIHLPNRTTDSAPTDNRDQQTFVSCSVESVLRWRDQATEGCAAFASGAPQKNRRRTMITSPALMLGSSARPFRIAPTS